MTRRLGLVALGLAVLVTASATVPAFADASATTTSSPPTRSAGPGAVPWDAVGPGWMVASWEPHPHQRPVATYLLLVAPSGVRYLLYRLPRGETTVAGWSGDGQRILVDTINQKAQILQVGRYDVIDLRTGSVEASFRPGGGVEGTARFTTPRGLALLAANHDGAGTQWLERYSLGGVPEVHYRDAFPGVKSWNGTWLEASDGTQIVMGAENGLAVVNNDGTLAETLPVPHATDCMPAESWGQGIILASCEPDSRQLGRSLYEFSENWPGPRQLTTAPSSEFGYTDAWHVGGRVLVQVQGPCGPPGLGQLRGHKVSYLNPPEPGDVTGSTAAALALEWEEGTDCGATSIAVKWYRPSTNTSVQVLGPPVSRGAVTSAVGYPTRRDGGGPWQGQ